MSLNIIIVFFIKVVRAKERLEMELDQKIVPDQISERTKDESNSDSQHS